MAGGWRRPRALRAASGAAALAAALVAGGCAATSEAPAAMAARDAELAALEAEVLALRDSLTRRAAADTLLAQIEAEAGHVQVLTRAALLRELLGWAAQAYLDDVRLSLRPDAVVRRTEEVRVRVGPLRIRAGSYDLDLTIRTIQATLRARAPRVAIADSSRLRVTVPVSVVEGAGDVRLAFRWNAAAIPSIICRGFEVDEAFAGTVPPRVHTLDGQIRLIAADDGIHAVPDFSRSEILVQPEPTPASWTRVREILDERDRISECGLAIDPERMQNMLAELLQRGFRFRLPRGVFPRLSLPGSVNERIEVEGRLVDLGTRPLRLRLTPDALWYSAAIEARLAPPDAPLTTEP